MSQFSLSQHPAKVVNHNARMERHGEELKLCSDLKIGVTIGAKTLDTFDPALRPFLYRERTLGDAPAQPRLDGDKEEEGLSRRLPLLDPLTLKEKLPGYAITIEPGMGLVEPIRLTKAELQNFEIEALDGGSVKLTFRAISYVSNAVSGELDGLQQRDVTVTIDPPASNAKADEAQGDLLTADTGAKEVTVMAVAKRAIKGGTLTAVTVTLSDAEEIEAGEFAHDPTLEDIADYLSNVHHLAVVFTPACEQAFAQAA